jgi:hypothetical protein
MHQHGDDRKALLKLSPSDISSLFRAHKTDRNYTDDGFGEAVLRIVGSWGVDYCPVYSITGSIISQEVVNYFKGSLGPHPATDIPALNWLVYDSMVGAAKITTLQQLK